MVYFLGMGYWVLVSVVACVIPGSESGGMADALDLGSSGQPWGFESPLSHQRSPALFPRVKRFQAVCAIPAIQ